MKHQSLFNALLILCIIILGGFLWRQQRDLRELRRQLQLADGSGASNLTRQQKISRMTPQGQASTVPGKSGKESGPIGENSRPASSQGTEGQSVSRTTTIQSGKDFTSRLYSPDIEIDFSPTLSGELIAGKGPRWGHQQAAGAPDTPNGGDVVTAWAPRSYGIGEQWLEVKYDRKVEISSINVHETYNPGAISKVTARMPDGSEKMIWAGTATAEQAPVETSIPVPPGITSDQVRIYVDTNRVRSWPEIDAVELLGKDGSRQWASSTTASSYYGQSTQGLTR
jgi:hypothetical protein